MPDEGAPILVHECMNLGDEKFVSSDLPAMLWDAFLLQLPEISAPERREQARGLPIPDGERRRGYLEALNAKTRRERRRRPHRRRKVEGDRSHSRGRSSSEGSRGVPESEGSRGVPDLESGDEEQALEAYMAKYRAKFQKEFPALDAWFRVLPRGAKSNRPKKGVIFDCVRSEAYSEQGFRWCAHYGLPKSFNACYSTCDTRANASIIAHAHFQKVCYLSGLWLDAGMGQLAYTDEMLAGHTEPADFTALVAVANNSAKCQRRIRLVQNLRPKAWRPVPE